MSVLRKWEAELLHHSIISLVLLNPVNHSTVILFNRNHFFVSRLVGGFVLKMKYFREKNALIHSYQGFHTSKASRLVENAKKIFELIIWRKILACLCI